MLITAELATSDELAPTSGPVPIMSLDGQEFRQICLGLNPVQEGPDQSPRWLYFQIWCLSGNGWKARPSPHPDIHPDVAVAPRVLTEAWVSLTVLCSVSASSPLLLRRTEEEAQVTN